MYYDEDTDEWYDYEDNYYDDEGHPEGEDQNDSATLESDAYYKGKGKGSKSKGNCLQCGSPWHWARDCPMNKTGKGNKDQSDSHYKGKGKGSKGKRRRRFKGKGKGKSGKKGSGKGKGFHRSFFNSGGGRASLFTPFCDDLPSTAAAPKPAHIFTATHSATSPSADQSQAAAWDRHPAAAIGAVSTKRLSLIHI